MTELNDILLIFVRLVKKSLIEVRDLLTKVSFALANVMVFL